MNSILLQKNSKNYIKNANKTENMGNFLHSNWKVKAFIQKFITLFPKPISYELYFQTQRYFGRLKKPLTPLPHFKAGVEMIEKIQKYGYEITGKTFFEVGTGRAPVLPVAFWLCGAEKTITMDANPYMRNEIVKDMCFFIKTCENEIKEIFGNLLNIDRFNLLLDKVKTNKIDKNDILKLCQIEYIAPGNAAKTGLNDKSIDYHISYTVYEHIRLNILKNILIEGNRIIAPDGLFVNCIDYGDHFSHLDKNISALNFLQFSDKKWEKHAGNRFMYMNRVRHDEFVELFKAVGHVFLEIDPLKNKAILEMLEKEEIMLDEKFKTKSNEILSITESWFVSKLPDDKHNDVS